VKDTKSLLRRAHALENNLEINGGLIRYLSTNKSGEYRVVVMDDGSCYIHPFNKDGETYDFSIEL
jgi:hypothetical protein